MDHRRTDSARENDDSDLIDAVEPAPSQGDSSGGNMPRDIGTEATLERIRDPEATEGVDKQNDIEHAQRYDTKRPADKQPGGNRSE